jgi:hypothetical protein
MRKTCLLLVLLIFAAGCSYTKPMTLYDFGPGPNLTGTFNDQTNKVTVTLYDGRKLKGEFTEFSGDSMSLAFTNQQFSGQFEGDNFQSFSGQSSSTTPIYHMSPQHKGHAILEGRDGYIMELVFVYNVYTDHGYGKARDSKGRTYRVKF